MEYCACIYELTSGQYITELNGEAFVLGKSDQRILFYDEGEAENTLDMLNDISDGVFVLINENS